MYFDNVALARELGIRTDAVLIILGKPTRLQRLIRGARTFEEVVALSDKFLEDQSGRSCGPKFEPEEKAEHEARRKELFPAYLQSFQTIESFMRFGFTASGSFILTSEEIGSGSMRLSELFTAKVNAAVILAEGRLDALILIREEMGGFPNAVHPSYRCQDNLDHEIERAFRAEFRTFMEAGDLDKVIDLFHRVARIKPQTLGHLSSSGLLDSGSYPWAGLWEREMDLEKLLRIEMEIHENFLDKSALQARLASLVEEAAEKLSSFEERLAFAGRFSSRDAYHPSRVYTSALEAAARKLETEADVRTMITICGIRREKFYRQSDRVPQTPSEVYEKFDELFLGDAESETDLVKLAKIMNDSPSATQTHQLADRKLCSHFDALVSEAQDEETVERIVKDARAMGAHISGVDRKTALREERRAAEAQTLWDAIERGETKDPKAGLKALFHEFEDDPVKRKAILRKLLPYYPAEAVEEVEA